MPYPLTSLEKRVHELYKIAGISDPHFDLTYMAERLGINFHFYHKSLYASGTILVDQGLSKEEQKEVFGHELCHALYHAGNQLIDSQLYREYQEHKANNFSLHFCIPTFMLREVLLPKKKYHAAAVVADLFCVTNEFAYKRLAHYEKQWFGFIFHKRLVMAAENKTKYEVL